MGIVELRQIHKTYPPAPAALRWLRRGLYGRSDRDRPRPALNGVDLDLAEGTILGLLGPRGAGKSTLQRIVAGLLAPTTGQARVCGLDPQQDRRKLQGRIGLLQRHRRLLRPNLSGLENMRLHISLHAPKVGASGPLARRLLAEVGLDEVADRPCREYGPDMRQRLAVARALISDPDVLIMDEATGGLDPDHRSHFYGFLLDHVRSRGCAVLYATHDLNEAQFLCHQVALMDRGLIVARGSYFEVQAAASEVFSQHIAEPDDEPRLLYPGRASSRDVQRITQAQPW